MDYAQLSHFQIQSLTDQEDYLRMPAILTGTSAGILPEQAAIWTYPTGGCDPDQASFNMVTGMVCRMHQSGRLDQLSNDAFQQVRRGIEQYKNLVRKHVPEAIPFYPLGLPDITDLNSPVALGMRAPQLTWIAVWRLDGPARVTIPAVLKQARIVFPTDLGIRVIQEDNQLAIDFPRTRMGCLLAT